MAKKELSHKVKLWIDRSTARLSPMLWTERSRSWIQATKMSFHRWVTAFSLRDQMRSLVKGGTLRRATAPLHRKEPVEVV